MRKVIIDVLIGIAFIVVLMILELFISFLYDTGIDLDQHPEERLRLVSLMYVTSALPAGLLTALAAFLLKTRTVADAVRRASIWGGIQLLDIFAVGLLNGTLSFIFGGYGFYVFLLLVAAGPFAAYLLVRRPAGAAA